MKISEHFGLILIARADAFAAAAHGSINHKRKWTFEPYIEHPRAVAKLLVDVGMPPKVVAAALLHDVVEDTPITNEQIVAEFGEQIGQWVAEVTEVSKKEDGNRATRKEKDRQHYAKASYAGKSIKLADMIDNGRDIVKHDPGFAVKYMQEMAALLEVLKDGNGILYHRAEEMVRANQHTLTEV